MTQETIPRNTIGMARVFWVASELARRNWFAFPTVRNQKGIDIIATKEVPGRTKFIEIQVKATQYDTAKFWFLTKGAGEYTPSGVTVLRICKTAIEVSFCPI